MEKRNLASSRPDLLAELKGQLSDIQNGATSTRCACPPTEEALIKGRLEALGYVE